MKFKKIALGILLLTIFISSITKQEILAAANPQNSPTAPSIGIMPYAEETIWKYRYFNGKKQKRLWSITYGKWLTDWIDVP